MGQLEMLQMEGDTKGSAKGDTSAKKDVQQGSNPQLAHQGSFSQGVSYTNSQ
ncbi:nuclear transcription factor Y subunit B-10-like, partial [Trifolium medium]|nr:nuclear transcription factor Y subunit B-10-like [Trifolium medium]